MEHNAKTLGNAIKEARLSQKMSQEAVAEQTGLSAAYIKHIEGGRRNPALKSLFKIVAVLNMSLDDIIYEKSLSNKDEKERQAIIRRLSQCSSKDLHVVRATVEALIESEKLMSEKQ